MVNLLFVDIIIVATKINANTFFMKSFYENKLITIIIYPKKKTEKSMLATYNIKNNIFFY